MQLIFVVESNKRSQSDYYYISETLKEFYNTLGHKLTPVFMNGKGNYKKTETEINRNKAKYKGKTVVFICYDIDSPNKPTYSLNLEIEEYAKNKGYETIWFNEDIEQVYVGTSISANEKTKVAKMFMANDKIKFVNKNNLLFTFISKKRSSNILVILDKYLMLSQK